MSNEEIVKAYREIIAEQQKTLEALGEVIEAQRKYMTLDFAAPTTIPTRSGPTYYERGG